MKYFIDFEFLEGDVPVKIFGLNVPKWLIKPNNTIQPISVGICSSDGRKYYAISKDFNLKEAWNRYDIKKEWYSIDESNQSTRDIKVYWIRENVLKPIYLELLSEETGLDYTNQEFYKSTQLMQSKFEYKQLKMLIEKYGKTNKQIAEEVKEFTSKHLLDNSLHDKQGEVIEQIEADATTKEFYGYYSDYDWVVFCWLFGRMIDLPKSFPMYCIDLKQTLDEKVNNLNWLYLRDTWNNSRMSIKTIGKGDSQEKDRPATFDEKSNRLKELDEYPKQTNEHNALANAEWIFELYKFLNRL